MTTPEPNLVALGYTQRWQALFEPYAAHGHEPARVVRSDRASRLVAIQDGIVRAVVATRLAKSAAGRPDLPAVGDWVALATHGAGSTPRIEAVLERATAIARGDPGKATAVQVLAANVDIVFVTHPAAGEPNLRRIERELALAWSSGARPIVLLTKADLVAVPSAAIDAVAAVAPGAEVLVTSAVAGDGLEPLYDRLAGHRTAVLIGPSGAGKSTLANALVGEERQATWAVRVQDSRGRHTTVARELIALPRGGLLIDTPGLRALGLTGGEDGIGAAFPEIEALAAACRFRDCSHADEPGCAIRAAAESGELPLERVQSFQKLRREMQFEARKANAGLRAEETRKWRSIHKASKEYYKKFGRR